MRKPKKYWEYDPHEIDLDKLELVASHDTIMAFFDMGDDGNQISEGGTVCHVDVSRKRRLPQWMI